MAQYILLALFLGLPTLLVILLRTSGAMLFFCVATSALLQQFLDPDASRLVNSMLPGGVDYVSLGVLAVPIAFSAVLFAGKVKSTALPLHILLAILAGLTSLLIVDRFLPTYLVVGYASSTPANLLNNYQTVVIMLGLMLSIFAIRSSIPKDHHKKGKH